MTEMPVPEETPRPREGLIDRTRRAVQEALEGFMQRQMGPFLEQTRQAVVTGAEEVFQKDIQPLLAGLKDRTLETVEELLQRQFGPFLDRSRQTFLNGLEHAGLVQKYTDTLVAGLRKLLTETVADAIQVQIPAYTRRVGRGAVRYTAAGVLLGLAVVLLVLGLVEGLQSAGLPPYASLLIGGAAAGVTALALLFRRSTPEAPGKKGPDREG